MWSNFFILLMRKLSPMRLHNLSNLDIGLVETRIQVFLHSRAGLFFRVPWWLAGERSMRKLNLSLPCHSLKNLTSIDYFWLRRNGANQWPRSKHHWGILQSLSTTYSKFNLKGINVVKVQDLRKDCHSDSSHISLTLWFRCYILTLCFKQSDLLQNT